MDRVAELFHGELGEEQTTQFTRQRILWMVQWSRGPRVLDWGCSQGVASRLISDKAEVVGYDTDASAIEYARTRYPNIRFTTAIDDAGTGFDSILLGEILEHQESPRALLDDVRKRLAPNGRLIITVPHGYNECEDHRHLFTMSTVLELIEPELHVVTLDFVDGYVRAVVTPEPTGWTLTREVMQRAEGDLVDQHRRERATRERVTAQAKLNVDLAARYEKLYVDLKSNPAFKVVRTVNWVRRRLPSVK